jgi:hypothetical protein
VAGLDVRVYPLWGKVGKVPKLLPCQASDEQQTFTELAPRAYFFGKASFSYFLIYGFNRFT